MERELFVQQDEIEAERRREDLQDVVLIRKQRVWLTMAN